MHYIELTFIQNGSCTIIAPADKTPRYIDYVIKQACDHVTFWFCNQTCM